MKKTFIIMALGLAVVFISSGAWAGPWGGRFYGRGPVVSNLTPEQQTQVLSLQQAHQEEIAPIQEQLFKKKMELRTLWLAQNMDQAKIDALQCEVFDLIDQIQKESSNLRAEILKVVTPSATTPAK
jgi:Spy/CpxP family protein refolding chaperone